MKRFEAIEEVKHDVYKKHWNESHTQIVKSNFLNGFDEGANYQKQIDENLAVEFAEWCTIKMTESILYMQKSTIQEKTSAELFQIFKSERTKKA